MQSIEHTAESVVAVAYSGTAALRSVELDSEYRHVQQRPNSSRASGTSEYKLYGYAKPSCSKSARRIFDRERISILNYD